MTVRCKSPAPELVRQSDKVRRSSFSTWTMCSFVQVQNEATVQSQTLDLLDACRILRNGRCCAHQRDGDADRATDGAAFVAHIAAEHKGPTLQQHAHQGMSSTTDRTLFSP
eukprot:3607597-Pleurochrysis_carterae.AAC.4